MPRFHVLLTDFAWADVEIERRTLAEIGAERICARVARQVATRLAGGVPECVVNRVA